MSPVVAATPSAVDAETLRLAITVIGSAFDNTAGSAQIVTWPELIGRLKNHDRRSRKDGTCWLPVSVRPTCACGDEKCPGERGHRIDANAIEVSALVLDTDKIDEDTAAAVPERLRELGLEAVVHTSYSDRAGDKRALRVVIPLDRPVAGEHWSRFWAAATKWLDIPCEPACCNPSRIWYLPACPPDGQPETWTIEGQPLCVDLIQAEAQRQVQEQAERDWRTQPRPEPIRGPVSVEERARRYVERMPAAISGSGGHLATYRVALALIKGFGLDEGAALSILREYSARCEPPWSEKELEHKIASARKAAKVPDGYLLECDRPEYERSWTDYPPPPSDEDAPPSGETCAPEEAIETPEPGTFGHALQVALGDVRQALGVSEAADREPLFRNACDLFAEEFPAAVWRVTGLISEGGIVMVAAEPKSGKTWVATEIGIGITTGTPVFGEFYAATGTVAYFYAEDQGRQIRNRIRALLAARDLGSEALGDRLHICPKGKYLDITRDEDLAWLVASCRELGTVDVLILDPLRDINSAAEDKSDEMSPVMRRLRLLGELLNCTVVVAHHAGKPTADSAKRRPGQRMRGSSAIYGATDSGIYLGIRGGNGTDRFEIDVDSEIKGGRSAGRFRLELEVEDDHEGAAVLARFAVNRESAKSSKEAEAEADDAKMFDLVRTLAMRGKHCSKSALRDHDESTVPDKRGRAALGRLIDAGRLRIVGGKVHLPEVGSERDEP